MERRSRLLCAVFLSCAAAPWVAGCGDGATTHFDLVIDADPCSRALATRLVVEVRDAAGEVVDVRDVTVGDGQQVELPTGIRLRPRGDDPARRWRVDATLYGEHGVPVAWQRARGGYEADTATEGRLLFDDGCVGVECLADQTCRAGQCVDAAELSTRPPRGGAPTACPPILFVDAGAGTDGDGCGDFAAPCASIEAGLDALPSVRGGVVYVHGAGRYGEVLVWEENGEGGTEEAPLVLKAWPDTGTPFIDATGERWGINIKAGWVVVDGFRVENANEHGLVINGSTNRYVQARRVELANNGVGEAPFENWAGLMVNNDARDLVLEAIHSHDNVAFVDGEDAPGILINLGIRVLVRQSRLVANSGSGLDLFRSREVDVVGNVIARNGADGVDGASPGTLVEGNRICGNGGAGIDGSSTDLVVRHNTLYENGEAGYRAGGDEAHRVLLLGNIIAGNAGPAFETAGAEVRPEANLYYGNGTDPNAAEAGPDAVFDDPELTGTEDCTLELGEGSPARGAGPDGRDLGASGANP